MSDSVLLYGASYSVYSRIVRLVLEECGQDYQLVETDIFDKDSLSKDYPTRHPFGKIPAFEHGGFKLYESDAIAHYIDGVLGAGELVPPDKRCEARCRQIMRIVDNYAYSSLVWGVFVEETEKGRAGQLEPVELEAARHVLSVLETLMQGPYLLGDKVYLADFWLVPVFAYLRLAPSGQELLQSTPKLSRWWALMAERESVQATRFPAEQPEED